MRAPLSKAARNERRKLKASTLNTIGLAIFGLGALTPVVTGSPSNENLGVVAFSSAAFYILHLLARLELRGLED